LNRAVETLHLARALHERGAVLDGHFRLSSGRHSAQFIQKFRILEDPRFVEPIARALADAFASDGPTVVVGAAVGGIILGYETARALRTNAVFVEKENGAPVLRRNFVLRPSDRALIVEDVVTTGKSTRETANVVKEHGGVVFGFASILNRSGRDNPFDTAYESLLKLDLETYEETKCPLCASGMQIDAPGSRYSGR